MTKKATAKRYHCGNCRFKTDDLAEARAHNVPAEGHAVWDTATDRLLEFSTDTVEPAPVTSESSLSF